MYLILPETEGCTLEDIELHFSDNTRRITDIEIKRNQIDVDIQWKKYSQIYFSFETVMHLQNIKWKLNDECF